MDYSINLASAIAPERVRRAVLAAWPGTGTVFAGTAEAFDEYEGTPVAVLVRSGLCPGSDFDTELSAGEAFARACGGDIELRVATALCTALGARALIGDGGRAGLTWMLVTEDGWHGRVVVDEDAFNEGMLVIDHALQPVPVAPEFPFQDPPEWERGWYDGGIVPGSGYRTVG